MSNRRRRVARARSASMSNTADQSGLRTNKAGWLVVSDMTISRPPRDGHMAFVRSPDQISIELLQKGEPLAPAEPWVSMPNVGSW